MKVNRSSETTSIRLGREDRRVIERGENLRGYFLFDYVKIADAENHAL